MGKPQPAGTLYPLFVIKAEQIRRNITVRRLPQQDHPVIPDVFCPGLHGKRVHGNGKIL